MLLSGTCGDVYKRQELHNGNSENEQLLLALLKELIALQKNAPAGNRDITERCV